MKVLIVLTFEGLLVLLESNEQDLRLTSTDLARNDGQSASVREREVKQIKHCVIATKASFGSESTAADRRLITASPTRTLDPTTPLRARSRRARKSICMGI